MFSREKFLTHVLGGNALKAIEKSLELIDVKDWSIYNVSDYLKGSPSGNFILNDEVSLHFERNLTRTDDNGFYMQMDFPNGIINMYFRNGQDLHFYEYKELLLSEGLLHFEYYKGNRLTEYYDKKTCDLGNITEKSNLDVLKDEGFSPDYAECKNRVLGKYKLEPFLEQLNNLKTLRQSINVPPSKGRK